MGEARLAVADLEVFVGHTDDPEERDAIQTRVHELRRAMG
jgi:regulator of sirC expression with transglutaminase-like and TPR domain